MKYSFLSGLRRSLAIAVAFGSAASFAPPAMANLFDANEIDNPDDFVLIAAPVGQTNRHQLLIVEQLSSVQACWSESFGTPTQIEPLLLSFDFTGICGRMSDANAYSVRIAGEDLGLQYALRVRDRGDDAVLVAAPMRLSSGLPELEIGRAYGAADGFVKLYLDSAWRLARRSYQGRTLGHVYLTSDYSIDTLSSLTGDVAIPSAIDDTPAPLDVPVWDDEPIEFGEPLGSSPSPVAEPDGEPMDAIEPVDAAPIAAPEPVEPEILDTEAPVDASEPIDAAPAEIEPIEIEPVEPEILGTEMPIDASEPIEPEPVDSVGIDAEPELTDSAEPVDIPADASAPVESEPVEVEPSEIEEPTEPELLEPEAPADTLDAEEPLDAELLDAEELVEPEALDLEEPIGAEPVAADEPVDSEPVISDEPVDAESLDTEEPAEPEALDLGEPSVVESGDDNAGEADVSADDVSPDTVDAKSQEAEPQDAESSQEAADEDEEDAS